jgi:CheY-like chemotaxis protein
MRSVSPYRASGQSLILMVDDNRDGNLARRSVLEELGYKVLTAACGDDALKLVKEHQFDLVVTDYKMSPMDGLELIKHLRAIEFRKPIILLSGFVDTLGMRPESTGADAVVQKSANEVSNLLRHTKRLLSPPRKPAGGSGSGSAPVRGKIASS